MEFCMSARQAVCLIPGTANIGAKLPEHFQHKWKPALHSEMYQDKENRAALPIPFKLEPL
ncbi:hypothetical protein DBA26_14620 [Brucella canis]|uniref:Uncharacterized protein n=4 Tax=Brucella TaxID=234 RepID=A9MAX3_BRUC2|nr:hypothetical protein BR0954 [Brucella suis 1330]ABX62026.1 Hypothetical protein, conserved [Brucella canis ATCC 23365]ACU47938.1 hypothetical protein BMI_I952 [Brucella microti CCM 4915]AEU05964.1 hypothetical protein BSVBI22_A0950 [Brucella suis VBI22]AHN46588.1 hypothetical protein BSS2_I0931 [Brucella suis bv. 1 str. S2]ATN19627.1 hypothetical protein CRN66_07030 [Brucella canis]ATQ52001.1 hypothetical protein CS875_04745 [Brucella suis]EFH33616.1 hypothetical protein BAYG_03169 [Bruce